VRPFKPGNVSVCSDHEDSPWDWVSKNGCLIHVGVLREQDNFCAGCGLLTRPKKEQLAEASCAKNSNLKKQTTYRSRECFGRITKCGPFFYSRSSVNSAGPHGSHQAILGFTVFCRSKSIALSNPSTQ
jgi:hypothetical protein